MTDRDLALAKATLTGPVPCAGCGKKPTKMHYPAGGNLHLWCSNTVDGAHTCAGEYDTDYYREVYRTEAEATIKWNELQREHAAHIAKRRA